MKEGNVTDLVFVVFYITIYVLLDSTSTQRSGVYINMYKQSTYLTAITIEHLPVMSLRHSLPTAIITGFF